jgi:hypothetical protein
MKSVVAIPPAAGDYSSADFAITEDGPVRRVIPRDGVDAPRRHLRAKVAVSNRH